MSELEQYAEKFRQRWGFDPRPVIEQEFRAGDYDLAGGTAYELSFIRAMLTGAAEGPLMPIPECDRAKYGDMNEVLYWEMLEGEDPDDRAIREAHGISYTDPVEGTVCRNGCGLTYQEISAGKMRSCKVPAHDLMLHAHPHDDGPPSTPQDEPHEHPQTGPGHMGWTHTHPHRHAPMSTDGQEARR